VVTITSAAVYAGFQSMRLLAMDQGWAFTELAPQLVIEASLATSLMAILGLVTRRWRGVGAPVVMLFLIAAAGWPNTGTKPPSDGRERSVVLITVDTLRRDHVSIHDDAVANDLTPTLDAFATEHAWFTDAVTVAPLTLPAHTTLLTGLRPSQHGVVTNGRMLPPDLDGIPLRLADDGYITGAFTSAAILHGSHGMRRWFHVYRDRLRPRPGARTLPLLARIDPLMDWYWPPPGLVTTPGDQTVDRALSWLNRQDDASVFLWVHLYDAHTPHQDRPKEAPEAELPHPCDYAGHTSVRYLSHTFKGPGNLGLPSGKACVDEGWTKLFQGASRYRQSVQFADEQVGRLLDGLKASGRWDEAKVVIVADHGESLTEHQMFMKHEHDVYGPVARVPLMVRGLEPGRYNQPVSTERVASTLVRLAGLTPRPNDPRPLDHTADAVRYTLGPMPAILSKTPIQVAARSVDRTVIVGERDRLERYDDRAENFNRLTLEERTVAEEPLPDDGILPMFPLDILSARPKRRNPVKAAPVRFGELLEDHRTFRKLQSGASAELQRARANLSTDDGSALPDEVKRSLEALGYTE
jgi:arylsulfatase A-like enzyme